MKGLQGRYLLRIVLVMVDIQNHEESLRELSKTSLINNVTIILCWSAAEGARYLEAFKTYENAAPTAIKQHQSSAYGDRMVDFITTPRSINKTDAVSLVSQFGTIRTAVNARHEDVAGIAGWGEKKVQRWCASVREPFRVKKAAKRGIGREESSRMQASRAGTLSRDVTTGEGELPSRPATASKKPAMPFEEESRDAESLFVDEEAAMQEIMAGMEEPERRRRPVVEQPEPPRKKRKEDDDVGEGVMAALSKLRKT